MFKLLVAICFAFFIFLCIHFLHFHYFNPYDRVNSVIGAAIFGYVVFLLGYFLLPSDEVLLRKFRIGSQRFVKALPVVVGSLLFFLLFIGYLEFYFTADRSITFRMLRITDERPTQSITADEMLAAYDTQGIILRRLDDLVYGGYLIKEDKAYKLTDKGSRILGVYRYTIDYLRMPKF